MNKYIQAYIDVVRSGVTEVCIEQYQLCDLIEKAFAEEDLHVDEEQLDRYMGLQKYFPYKLLPWESFLFALHNCVYDADGDLRWPCLFVMVGRGAGKNGYLAFEDFALLTPINGVREYHIDIFATSEDQARATFDDIWNILEADKDYFKKYYTWTKEEIVNKKTGSKLKYHTSAPKTKDGGRPGKVDFDEYHAYENSALEDVAVTGLGKKDYPRRTYITTQGNVRGGSLDKMLEKAEKVLSGERPDGGWLYFICRLDSDAEIQEPGKWGKANPSLHDPNRRALLKEIKLEFQEYLDDPAGHGAFATKRMNRPAGDKETEVTSWENIKAASRPLPDKSVLVGRPAVFGVDYASTQDFVAAGILILVDEEWIWISHTWVCAQSPSLKRIRFPLQEAEARGELTMVDLPEIPPEMPADWVEQMRDEYQLLMGGVDHFRYTLLAKAFTARGWNADRRKGNLKLTYTPEQSMVAPLISSAFLNQRICWGDSMIMRWYTNNAIRIIDRKGNISYGKIEPKSRKTDGFMAFVAAFIVAQIKLDEMTYYNLDTTLPDVYVY